MYPLSLPTPSPLYCLHLLMWAWVVPERKVGFDTTFRHTSLTLLLPLFLTLLFLLLLPILMPAIHSSQVKSSWIAICQTNTRMWYGQNSTGVSTTTSKPLSQGFDSPKTSARRKRQRRHRSSLSSNIEYSLFYEEKQQQEIVGRVMQMLTVNSRTSFSVAVGDLQLCGPGAFFVESRLHLFSQPWVGDLENLHQSAEGPCPTLRQKF